MNTLDIIFIEKKTNFPKSNIKLSNSDKLLLYGLNKQAIFGNINKQKPLFYKYNERQKWYAWKKNFNMTKNSAKNKYILIIDEIIRDNKFNNLLNMYCLFGRYEHTFSKT